MKYKVLRFNYPLVKGKDVKMILDETDWQTERFIEFGSSANAAIVEKVSL
jgi:hypothetical protein